MSEVVCCWVEADPAGVDKPHYWDFYPEFYEEDKNFPEGTYPEIWWWEVEDGE